MVSAPFSLISHRKKSTAVASVLLHCFRSALQCRPICMLLSATLSSAAKSAKRADFFSLVHLQIPLNVRCPGMLQEKRACTSIVCCYVYSYMFIYKFVYMSISCCCILSMFIFRLKSSATKSCPSAKHL